MEQNAAMRAPRGGSADRGRSAVGEALLEGVGSEDTETS